MSRFKVITKASSASKNRTKYLSSTKIKEHETLIGSSRPIFSNKANRLTWKPAEKILQDGIKDNRYRELVVGIKNDYFDRLGKTNEEREFYFRAAVRDGMKNLLSEINSTGANWVAALHRNTDAPHVHILIGEKFNAVDKDGKKIIKNLPEQMPLPKALIKTDEENKTRASEIFLDQLEKYVKGLEPSEQITRNPNNSLIPPHSPQFYENGFSYMMNEQIHPLIVSRLENKTVLYRESGSPVFLKRDENGEATGAIFQNGKDAGSRNWSETGKGHGYFYTGNLKDAAKYIIVDSPIEALALESLHQKRDLSKAAFISLGNTDGNEEFINLLKSRIASGDEISVIWAKSNTSKIENGEYLQNKKGLAELQRLIENPVNPQTNVSLSYFAPQTGRTWSDELKISERVRVREWQALKQIEYLEKTYTGQNLADTENAGRTIPQIDTVPAHPDILNGKRAFSVTVAKYEEEVKKNRPTETQLKAIRQKALSDRNQQYAKETEELRRIPLSWVANMYGLYESRSESSKANGTVMFRDPANRFKIQVKTSANIFEDFYNRKQDGSDPANFRRAGAVNLAIYLSGHRMDYTEARKMLVEQFLGAGSIPLPERAAPKFDVVPLSLCSRDDEQTDRIVNYLEQRGISRETQDLVLDNNTLFANSYGSVTFVMRSFEDGSVTGHNWRSITEGDNRRMNTTGTFKDFGSFFLGNPQKAEKIIFVEAPIEALSYYELNKENDWSKTAIIALHGISLSANHRELVKSDVNKEIVIALNNSVDADKSAVRMRNEFEALGKEVSVESPFIGEDWNDYIQLVKSGNSSDLESLPVEEFERHFLNDFTEKFKDFDAFAEYAAANQETDIDISIEAENLLPESDVQFVERAYWTGDAADMDGATFLTLLYDSVESKDSLEPKQTYAYFTEAERESDLLRLTREQNLQIINSADLKEERKINEFGVEGSETYKTVTGYLADVEKNIDSFIQIDDTTRRSLSQTPSGTELNVIKENWHLQRIRLENSLNNVFAFSETKPVFKDAINLKIEELYKKLDSEYAPLDKEIELPEEDILRLQSQVDGIVIEVASGSQEITDGAEDTQNTVQSEESEETAGDNFLDAQAVIDENERKQLDTLENVVLKLEGNEFQEVPASDLHPVFTRAFENFIADHPRRDALLPFQNDFTDAALNLVVSKGREVGDLAKGRNRLSAEKVLYAVEQNSGEYVKRPEAFLIEAVCQTSLPDSPDGLRGYWNELEQNGVEIFTQKDLVTKNLEKYILEEHEYFEDEIIAYEETDNPMEMQAVLGSGLIWRGQAESAGQIAILAQSYSTSVMRRADILTRTGAYLKSDIETSRFEAGKITAAISMVRDGFDGLYRCSTEAYLDNTELDEPLTLKSSGFLTQREAALAGKERILTFLEEAQASDTELKAIAEKIDEKIFGVSAAVKSVSEPEPPKGNEEPAETQPSDEVPVPQAAQDTVIENLKIRFNRQSEIIKRSEAANTFINQFEREKLAKVLRYINLTEKERTSLDEKEYVEHENLVKEYKVYTEAIASFEEGQVRESYIEIKTVKTPEGNFISTLNGDLWSDIHTAANNNYSLFGDEGEKKRGGYEKETFVLDRLNERSEGADQYEVKINLLSAAVRSIEAINTDENYKPILDRAANNLKLKLEQTGNEYNKLNEAKAWNERLTALEVSAHKQRGSTHTLTFSDGISWTGKGNDFDTAYSLASNFRNDIILRDGIVDKRGFYLESEFNTESIYQEDSNRLTLKYLQDPISQEYKGYIDARLGQEIGPVRNISLKSKGFESLAELKAHSAGHVRKDIEGNVIARAGVANKGLFKAVISSLEEYELNAQLELNTLLKEGVTDEQGTEQRGINETEAQENQTGKPETDTAARTAENEGERIESEIPDIQSQNNLIAEEVSRKYAGFYVPLEKALGAETMFALSKEYDLKTARTVLGSKAMDALVAEHLDDEKPFTKATGREIYNVYADELAYRLYKNNFEQIQDAEKATIAGEIKSKLADKGFLGIELESGLIVFDENLYHEIQTAVEKSSSAGIEAEKEENTAVEAQATDETVVSVDDTAIVNNDEQENSQPETVEENTAQLPILSGQAIEDAANLTLYLQEKVRGFEDYPQFLEYFSDTAHFHTELVQSNRNNLNFRSQNDRNVYIEKVLPKYLNQALNLSAKSKMKHVADTEAFFNAFAAEKQFEPVPQVAPAPAEVAEVAVEVEAVESPAVVAVAEEAETPIETIETPTAEIKAVTDETQTETPVEASASADNETRNETQIEIIVNDAVSSSDAVQLLSENEYYNGSRLLQKKNSKTSDYIHFDSANDKNSVRLENYELFDSSQLKVADLSKAAVVRSFLETKKNELSKQLENAKEQSTIIETAKNIGRIDGYLMTVAELESKNFPIPFSLKNAEELGLTDVAQELQYDAIGNDRKLRILNPANLKHLGPAEYNEYQRLTANSNQKDIPQIVDSKTNELPQTASDGNTANEQQENTHSQQVNEAENKMEDSRTDELSSVESSILNATNQIPAEEIPQETNLEASLIESETAAVAETAPVVQTNDVSAEAQKVESVEEPQTEAELVFYKLNESNRQKDVDLQGLKRSFRNEQEPTFSYANYIWGEKAAAESLISAWQEKNALTDEETSSYIQVVEDERFSQGLGTIRKEIWEMSKSDFLASQYTLKIISLEKGITHLGDDIEKLEARSAESKLTKREERELNIKKLSLESKTERLESFDLQETEVKSFGKYYVAEVAKAISKGKVSEERRLELAGVDPAFRKALDNRERYEKGRNTSFGNRTQAVNDSMLEEKGYKVKRQDGKEITPEQIEYISEGIKEIESVFGNMKDTFRKGDITIVHTNGKMPFLTVAGGLYVSTERSIVIGVKGGFTGRDIPSLAHEIGHWIDNEAGSHVIQSRNNIDQANIFNYQTRKLVGKSSMLSEITDRHSEFGDDRSLIKRASELMSGSKHNPIVKKALKMKNSEIENLSADEQYQIERARTVLGNYYYSPREIFARLFEQYISYKTDGKSQISASPNYSNYLAYWNKDSFESLVPELEKAIKWRLELVAQKLDVEQTAKLEQETPIDKVVPEVIGNAEVGQIVIDGEKAEINSEIEEVQNVFTESPELEKVKALSADEKLLLADKITQAETILNGISDAGMSAEEFENFDSLREAALTGFNKLRKDAGIEVENNVQEDITAQAVEATGEVQEIAPANQPQILWKPKPINIFQLEGNNKAETAQRFQRETALRAKASELLNSYNPDESSIELTPEIRSLASNMTVLGEAFEDNFTTADVIERAKKYAVAVYPQTADVQITDSEVKELPSQSEESGNTEIEPQVSAASEIVSAVAVVAEPAEIQNESVIVEPAIVSENTAQNTSSQKALIAETDAPKGTFAFAEYVKSAISDNKSLGNNTQITKIAADYFGSHVSEGKYSTQDIYNAVELGMNLWIKENANALVENFSITSLEELNSKMQLLPTQTGRTDDKIKLQQFSTPPSEAFAVYKMANVKKSDIVLEPSAGTGMLAAFAIGQGVKTIANEIDAKRADCLRYLGADEVYGVNAQFLNSLLRPEIKPTVVLMNPPFSSSVYTNRNQNKNGGDHVIQALNRLEENGRLVTILGEGAEIGRTGLEKMWSHVFSRATLQANLGINGQEYRKYGTTFGNQIIVLDKVQNSLSRVEAVNQTRIASNLSISGVLENYADEISHSRNQYLAAAGSRLEMEGISQSNLGAVGRGITGSLPADAASVEGSVRTLDGDTIGTGTREHHHDLGNNGREELEQRAEGDNSSNSDFNGLAQETESIEAKDESNSNYALGKQPFEVIRSEAFDIDRGLKAISNNLNEPTVNTFSPGQFAIESIGDDPYIFRLEMVSPTNTDYAEKYDAEEVVANYPTTQKYADWYREGLIPEPITVVKQQQTNKLISLNRRRLIAARVAGVNEIPAWIELGKHQEIIAEAVRAKTLDMNSDTGKAVLAAYPDLKESLKQEISEAANKDLFAEQDSVSAQRKQLERDALVKKLVDEFRSVIKYEDNPQPKRELPDGTVEYQVERMTGAKKHPAFIIESPSLAAVKQPKLHYVPAIPKNLIESGAISDLQLEAIILAGQQHSKWIEGKGWSGIIIGDGGGVGKTTEFLGITLDNWNQGRRRVLFMTLNDRAFPGLENDMKRLGMQDIPLAEISKFKVGDDLNHRFGDGIIFCPYPTFISQGKNNVSRYDQLKNWLGTECLIIKDECHRMQNYFVSQGKGSLTGELAVQLENEIPNARIVYGSATFAKDINAMAQFTRLGLWGSGTQFPEGFEEFKGQIGTSGTGAMELAAFHLKSTGKMVAREISWLGTAVNFEEKKLEPEQVELYDKTAQAWQMFYQKMSEALEVSNSKGSFQERMSNQLFFAANQRFYNQFILAVKMPMLLSIGDKYANQKVEYTDPHTQEVTTHGSKVVFAIMGTGESRTQAQVKRAVAEGISLDELDFSPREIIVDLAKKHFPTTLHTESVDDEGKSIVVPVTDEHGNPVICAEAAAIQKEIIESLQGLELPDNPLDTLVNYYGRENVAEVTGRQKGLYINPATGRKEYRRRVESGPIEKASRIEMEAFQTNQKDFGIISRSGSAAISMHDDKNRDVESKMRFMVLSQIPPSSVDAMQLMWRVLRSNSHTQPTYVLPLTDIPGETRFMMMVAGKLQSMGAITRGDRNMASGVNMTEFALENKYGNAAAYNVAYKLQKNDGELVENLRNENVDRSGNEILYSMGLAKKTPQGMIVIDNSKVEKINAKTFFNRLLMLDIATQRVLYNQFYDLYEKAVDFDKKLGIYDAGVTDIKGERIRIAEKRVVNVDEETGAETYYTKILADVKTKKLTFERTQELIANKDTDDYKHCTYQKNISTNNLFFAEKTGTRFDGKDWISSYRLTNPSGLVSYMNDKDLTRKFSQVQPDSRIENSDMFSSSRYIKVEDKWKEMAERTPDFLTNEHHIIGGKVLDIYRHLNKAKLIKSEDQEYQGLQTVRVVTQDNERVLGINVPNYAIKQVLRELAVDHSPVDGMEVYQNILNTGEKVNLVEGVSLLRGNFKGRRVVEINGFDRGAGKDAIETIGVMREFTNARLMYFVPNNDETAGEVMNKLLERYPILGEEKTVEETGRQIGQNVVELTKESSNVYSLQDSGNEVSAPKNGFRVLELSKDDNNVYILKDTETSQEIIKGDEKQTTDYLEKFAYLNSPKETEKYLGVESNVELPNKTIEYLTKFNLETTVADRAWHKAETLSEYEKVLFTKKARLLEIPIPQANRKNAEYLDNDHIVHFKKLDVPEANAYLEKYYNKETTYRAIEAKNATKYEMVLNYQNGEINFLHSYNYSDPTVRREKITITTTEGVSLSSPRELLQANSRPFTIEDLIEAHTEVSVKNLSDKEELAAGPITDKPENLSQNDNTEVPIKKDEKDMPDIKTQQTDTANAENIEPERALKITDPYLTQLRETLESSRKFGNYINKDDESSIVWKEGKSLVQEKVSEDKFDQRQWQKAVKRAEKIVSEDYGISNSNIFRASVVEQIAQAEFDSVQQKTEKIFERDNAPAEAQAEKHEELLTTLVAMQEQIDKGNALTDANKTSIINQLRIYSMDNRDLKGLRTLNQMRDELPETVRHNDYEQGRSKAFSEITHEEACYSAEAQNHLQINAKNIRVLVFDDEGKVISRNNFEKLDAEKANVQAHGWSANDAFKVENQTNRITTDLNERIAQYEHLDQVGSNKIGQAINPFRNPFSQISSVMEGKYLQRQLDIAGRIKNDPLVLLAGGIMDKIEAKAALSQIKESYKEVESLKDERLAFISNSIKPQVNAEIGELGQKLSGQTNYLNAMSKELNENARQSADYLQSEPKVIYENNELEMLGEIATRAGSINGLNLYQDRVKEKIENVNNFRQYMARDYNIQLDDLNTALTPALSHHLYEMAQKPISFNDETFLKENYNLRGAGKLSELKAGILITSLKNPQDGEERQAAFKDYFTRLAEAAEAKEPPLIESEVSARIRGQLAFTEIKVEALKARFEEEYAPRKEDGRVSAQSLDEPVGVELGDEYKFLNPSDHYSTWKDNEIEAARNQVYQNKQLFDETIERYQNAGRVLAIQLNDLEASDMYRPQLGDGMKLLRAGEVGEIFNESTVIADDETGINIGNAGIVELKLDDVQIADGLNQQTQIITLNDDESESAIASLDVKRLTDLSESEFADIGEAIQSSETSQAEVVQMEKPTQMELG